ncbi:hypothetical protein ABZ942_14755 [Nocardia sp. NPDC046473]|uniref:hypothetical protein n=1 Tax=Nocardia sp. NPDC046473 TaxID=3155733 RepID=UPI0033C33744
MGMISFVPARILIIRGGNLKLSNRTRAAAAAVFLTGTITSSAVAYAAPFEPPANLDSTQLTKIMKEQYGPTLDKAICSKGDLPSSVLDEFSDARDQSPLEGGADAELEARTTIRVKTTGSKNKDGVYNPKPAYGEAARKAMESDTGGNYSNAFRRLICDNAEAKDDYAAVRKELLKHLKFRPGFEENIKLVKFDYVKLMKEYDILCKAGLPLEPAGEQTCDNDASKQLAEKKKAESDQKD